MHVHKCWSDVAYAHASEGTCRKSACLGTRRMGEYHIKEGCVRVSVCAQFSAERIESARVCVPVELRRLHIP
jgi:hypothetical protein